MPRTLDFKSGILLRRSSVPIKFQYLGFKCRMKGFHIPSFRRPFPVQFRSRGPISDLGSFELTCWDLSEVSGLWSYLANKCNNVAPKSWLIFLGELQRIVVWYDGTGANPAWYLQYVMITERRSGKKYIAECFSWFRARFKKQSFQLSQVLVH